jgi:hypothetical protein
MGNWLLITASAINQILSVANQKLGDTILLTENNNDKSVGLAVCHCGPRTEAGSNTSYVKFGMVAGNGELPASGNFEYLLESCELFAASQGLLPESTLAIWLHIEK